MIHSNGQPHLVPLHDLSYAYNLFFWVPNDRWPGLDDRLFPLILYPFISGFLLLHAVYGCFLFVHAFNKNGDSKLEVQSHRFVADFAR
jgi:hypothetical protein